MNGMNDFNLIVWLLPIVFMIHDFEEIIFMQQWIERNRGDLERRFPKLAPRILKSAGSLSTAGVAIAVAEEFVLLSAITVSAVLTGWYFLWLAAFMAFALHLLMHVGQWIAVRRYIPAIGTTFLVLVYCSWGLSEIVTHKVFSPSQIVLWTVVGVVVMALNLLLAHKLAEKFDKR